MENSHIDVFVNPTRKEILEVKNSTEQNWIRYIIDINKKKLYVFNSKLIHHFVAEKIGVKYTMGSNEDAIFGIGVSTKEGKLKTGDNEAMKAIKENDWLKRYFE